MKKFIVKWIHTYSEQINQWETDSQEDAYIYFNDLCKSSSTAKCKLYKEGKLISTFINSKWKTKKKR